MAAFLTVLFFGVFLVVLIFSMVAFAQNHRRRREEAWRRVADSRGLDFFPGSWTSGPAMAGSVNGFLISIDTQHTSENEQVTRYNVSYPSTGQRAVDLSKQSSLHFTLVKRVLGKNDVEIGDPTFDNRVLIDASDPVSAARYLSPARRQAVLHIFGADAFKNPKVSDTSVVVETVGIESDAHNLDRVLEILLGTARTMSEPTDVDLSMSPPPPQPKPRPVDAVIETIPDPALRADDTPLDAVAPALDAVAPAPDAVAPAPPQDTVLEPEPEPELVPQPDPGVSLDLGQHAVAADLFDSGRMGFETTTHFDAMYTGAEIRWSGEIDQVREHRGDMDFDEPGTKVTVLMGPTGESTLRSGQPKAVVQFGEGLSLSRGDDIDFTGTLVRCDRYTRSVYVADGHLIDNDSLHNG